MRDVLALISTHRSAVDGPPSVQRAAGVAAVHVPLHGVVGAAGQLASITQRPCQVVGIQDFHDPLGRLQLIPSSGRQGASAPLIAPEEGASTAQGDEADDVVSGISQDHQWAVLMPASGQPRGRLRAVSRGRRQKGWERSFHPSMNARILVLRSCTDLNTPRRMAWRSTMPNQTSTSEVRLTPANRAGSAAMTSSNGSITFHTVRQVVPSWRAMPATEGCSRRIWLIARQHARVAMSARGRARSSCCSVHDPLAQRCSAQRQVRLHQISRTGGRSTARRSGRHRGDRG